MFLLCVEHELYVAVHVAEFAPSRTRSRVFFIAVICVCYCFTALAAAGRREEPASCAAAEGKVRGHELTRKCKRNRSESPREDVARHGSTTGAMASNL